MKKWYYVKLNSSDVVMTWSTKQANVEANDGVSPMAWREGGRRDLLTMACGVNMMTISISVT